MALNDEPKARPGETLADEYVEAILHILRDRLPGHCFKARMSPTEPGKFDFCFGYLAHPGGHWPVQEKVERAGEMKIP